MVAKSRLEGILVDIPRNADDRGEAVKVMTVEKTGWPVRDTIFISSKPGVVRGAHYHKLKEEVFVVVLGRMQATLVDTKTGERKELMLDDRKRQMLFIHPYVAHAIKNVGNETAWFVEVQDTDYDKNDDYKFDM